MTRTTLDLGWGEVSCLCWRPEGTLRRSPVLLLHGGGVDNAELSWGEAGPRLAAAGHWVVAPDHPGFGESAPAPWPATQQNLLRYVADVTRALGWRRYAVAGLSLGGGLAIGHTLAHPDRVVAVIPCGSYGIMPRLADGAVGALSHALAWATLRSGLMAVALRWYARDRRLLERGMRDIVRSRQRRTPELLDEIVLAARGPALHTFAQWQRDQLRWGRVRTDYSAQLGEIGCPALVVHGELDTGVPIARARAAAAALPHGRLLAVAGAGHWVQRDRPDVVVPAMIDFLAEAEE